MFARLISAVRIVGSRDQEARPVLDALGCSRTKTGLATEPKAFEVGIRIWEEEKKKKKKKKKQRFGGIEKTDEKERGEEKGFDLFEICFEL